MIPRLVSTSKDCQEDCQSTLHVDTARSHVPLAELYGNRPQLPSSISGLLSVGLLKGISKRKLFSKNGQSECSDCSNTGSTRETRSLSFDDDETEDIDEHSSSPAQEQLKIAGFKWICADSGEKYAQLNFVPQETIVLVRRAPVRQRSLIRQMHRQSSNSNMSNHSQRSIVIVGERPVRIQGRTQTMDGSHHSVSRRHATRQARRLSNC